MKSIAIIFNFLAAALAAPFAPLSPRQQGSLPVPPAITSVSYWVSNLADLANPKAVETKLLVNSGVLEWSADSELMGAGTSRLNTDGLLYATRVDITSLIDGIHCNVYNTEKHVVAEPSPDVMGDDLPGVPGVATYADFYSMLCFYM